MTDNGKGFFKHMQGKLVVLEGIDGSGKSTQFKQLCRRLDGEKMQFHRIIFPRYKNPSSMLIRMYLSGELGGSPGDVNAYAASTFYAADRYASYHTDWLDKYKSGGLIMADRYTTSNAVHQGAKLPVSELDAFLKWLFDFEYNKMELPEPDLVIYLDVDVQTAVSSMRSREKKTGSAGDIHEQDTAYLESCAATGRRAAELCSWTRIKCDENGVMRSVEDIHEEIYEKLCPVIQGAEIIKM